MNLGLWEAETSRRPKPAGSSGRVSSTLLPESTATCSLLARAPRPPPALGLTFRSSHSARGIGQIQENGREGWMQEVEVVKVGQLGSQHGLLATGSSKGRARVTGRAHTSPTQGIFHKGRGQDGVISFLLEVKPDPSHNDVSDGAACQHSVWDTGIPYAAPSVTQLPANAPDKLEDGLCYPHENQMEFQISGLCLSSPGHSRHLGSESINQTTSH